MNLIGTIVAYPNVATPRDTTCQGVLMRGTAKAWLLSLAAVATLGCGDDNSDPVGPGSLTQADIAGTWTVTRLEFSEHAPGTRDFDFIADGDGTAVMSIAANGDYTIQMTQGQDTETNTGNFEVTDEGVLDTSEGNSEPSVWEFTLDGTTLTGESNDGGHDFEDDGTEESVDVHVTLVKVN
jgi:hypothetical protein